MTEFPKFIFINDASIRHGRNENVIRSEMESGLPKTKPKDSVPSTVTSFEISLHRSDLSKFYDWLDTKVNKGSDWFLMRHPVFGDIRRVRFQATNFQWAKLGTLFAANITIEAYDV